MAGADANGRATEHIVTNPSDWPGGKIDEVHEPIVKTTILAPSEFIGAIMGRK